MDVLELFKEIITGGLNPRVIWMLFILTLAVMAAKKFNSTTDQVLDWLYVMRNDRLKKGTWMSFGTAVGSEAGQCVKRGIKQVEYRVWSDKYQCFYKIKGIPPGQLRHMAKDYLEARPQGIPFESKKVASAPVNRQQKRK